MVVITLPIVFPIITSPSCDGVWFGIIITKTIEIGLITPPVGVNVYIVRKSSPIPLEMSDIFRGVSWFLVMDVVTLFLLITFPKISLWL